MRSSSAAPSGLCATRLTSSAIPAVLPCMAAFLRRTLAQLHLDRIDTGDLRLLGLLYFLCREKADEELLAALGLLLIL